MINHKYVAIDIHPANVFVQVQNDSGKSLLKSIIETDPNTVRYFISSISDTVHVTFEAECHSASLYDLIHPLVAEVSLCDRFASRKSESQKSKVGDL